jgi:hypothetical protein
MSVKLFIGGLAWGTSEDSLREAFGTLQYLLHAHSFTHSISLFIIAREIWSN